MTMKKNLKSMFLAGMSFLAMSASIFALKPDLVVLSVTSPNLDYGIVQVAVKNQGDAPAASCYIAIRITTVEGVMKIFSHYVPPMAVGKTQVMQTQTGFLLSQAKYEVTVDRSNTVPESNELNNVLKGQFGGKP